MMNVPDPEVDVIIVNWNSGKRLRECLTALAGSTSAGRLNIIIVDNASSDTSALNIVIPSLHISIIHNATNRGFGAACNQGATATHAPNILFLNSDVRVEPDSIERAAAFLTNPAHERVGVVGIRLTDRDGHTSRTSARRPTLLALLFRTLFLDRIAPRLVPPHFLLEWDHMDTREVDQVMGAFLMIRRPLFQRLHGFDERFFVYYEDLDLCLRAADAGDAVVHVADAKAFHEGGGSTSTVKDRRFNYEATSRVLFTAKHHGAANALLLAALISIAEIPLRLLHAVLAGGRHDARVVWGGALLFWRDLPHTVRSMDRN